MQRRSARNGKQPKKLLRWKKIIEREINAGTELSTYLRKRGFIKKRLNPCWIHRGHRIVIKYPLHVSRTPPSRFIPPTLFMPISNGSSHLVIQSLCQVPRSFKRRSEIVRQLDDTLPKSWGIVDLIERNVGLYKRRPVMFDW